MKRRIIKFRVWNNKTKSWAHGPGQEPHLFGETILLGGFMQVPLLELNDCIPLQFTGMLDKNGKEIYEGDIVRAYMPDCYKNWIWRTGIVAFDEVMGMYSVYDSIEDISKESLGSALICDGEEVLGNIYENPEIELGSGEVD